MSAHPVLRTARRAVRPVARAVRRHLLPRLMPVARHAFPEAAARVRVVGLLSSSSGLGESARLCLGSLAGAGYRLSTADVAGLFDSNDGIAYPAGESDPQADLAIYHLNPPMLLPSVVRTGLRRHAGTYSIAYWAWELETLPAEWIAAIRFVDAILVPSRFCQAALRAHTDKPVIVVPHPVDAAVPVREAAAPPPGDRFRVASIFNFGSSYARKNPTALVRAFRAAFGEDPGAELVLKVSDGARYPRERAQILAEMAGAPNVRLIDEVWERPRLQAFLASADAYLSLHRSEGFGLTLAEAILARVPVVATHWSGNTDFCDPALSYPVDYALVPFSDPHPAYAGVGAARWAEPDIAHAAHQLRQVRGEPEAARAKARALRSAFVTYLRRHGYEEALASLARPAQAA
ncbi:glycosyltransferase family 4 protein [Methylobacterium sp. WSM2598]|uniref:glycosyltransferase family 4 protein n=1 Tax=Methylobacterium sp. WSM2598 TaxID=398261 RepID=UPI00037C593F|nr:glycosyltransferase family 4 protein [Methylobacterium sp. WSM2598]